MNIMNYGFGLKYKMVNNLTRLRDKLNNLLKIQTNLGQTNINIKIK